ncbi:protein ZGRF1-like isoform X3 [Scyliorhinus canicula]|uniref:protein ZGRF1-like isoform X3 n=1 Tax=Scyliorhinus canicula TaxID=7830 RepID=UPI0018F63E3A|nr:protein ZGRF1-like isoform X3 [Scyliorhinus canicula]
MSCREFVVLYTNQKTKKAKKWHDGVLKTSSFGNKATLYDDKGLCLDHIYAKFEEIQSGRDFESDRYLITVEEEKTSKKEDAKCSGQKEATKLDPSNIIPAKLTRYHLPVGLKRKHTGFQGPREVPKKPTTEENDTTCAMTKPQKPSFSLPQFYATSPLFSTACAEEALTCSASLSEDSSCTYRKEPAKETTTSLSLPSTPALNHYKHLRHCEEMVPFHSTDSKFVYYNDGIAPSTALTSNPGVCSRTNLICESKRSKAQILALLDTKTMSSDHAFETFELKPQQPLVDFGSTYATGQKWESGFDPRDDYPVENTNSRLIESCNTELPTFLTDHTSKVNLSKDLGGGGSSQNIQPIQQQCEEREDSVTPAANVQFVTPGTCMTTTLGETLDNSVCKVKKCSVEANSPSRRSFSLADDEHSKNSVMSMESDTVDTNNFTDVNFDLLGEFNLDEMGMNDLSESEIEMLPQTSLNISNCSSQPIQPPSLHKDAHQPKHPELEAQILVTEEEDSDQILHGKCQTEIESRAVANAESLSGKPSSVAREKPVLELKEGRINADEYSCLPAQRDTITLLKSLSEHSTAIESLEKLNIQKLFKDATIESVENLNVQKLLKDAAIERVENLNDQKLFEDAAINTGLEQPNVRPGGTSGWMIFKNVKSKHVYNLDHNPGYNSIDCNADRALRMFETEQSLPAVRNSPTGNSCAPAKILGCTEAFEEHIDNNWLEKITASDRPVRALQVNSPTQEVPSGAIFVDNVLQCSRDNLQSNVGELEFSVPTHQPSLSGNERPNNFMNNAVLRTQSAFRPRTPLVTMPTTDKCIDQTLASSSFESLSGMIEPDELIQRSAIYSRKGRQGDLHDCSESRVRPESINRNCETSANNADAYTLELVTPKSFQATLQTQASKWLKYQIAEQCNPVSPNSGSWREQDHIFGTGRMFEMAAFKEGNGKALAIQENVNDSFSMQLIKDKLIEQHESVLGVNETHALPIVSSVRRGRNALSKTNNYGADSESIRLSELCFPRTVVSQGTKAVKRQVTIPATFHSPTHYRQVFTAAITEHLNIWLFELSQKLHKALSKVDISEYSSEKARSAGKEQKWVPLCQHQQPAKLVMVKKEGPNKGRLFYTCDASKTDQCKFFKWLDHMHPIDLEQKMEHQSKLMLSDAKSLGAFIRSQDISMYSECVLHVRKTSAFQKKRFYCGKLKTLVNKEGDLESSCKTKLYLGLSRKESSSVYNKDDLWVVSKTLMFDPLDSFVACSVFYGPSSTSEVELLPLKGYSPSKWSSDMIVHALFVGNASTELTCLKNLQEHFNPASLPLLPFLLRMPCCEEEAIVRPARGRFVSPALKIPAVTMGLLCKERVVALATKIIPKFNLNSDQAAAFRQVAVMMAKGENPQDLILPVTVIHGVYGAGKSYLLAVVILFLVQLFEESEAVEGPRQVPWKLLISASTNVAVDRVLLGLLELGFNRFIRVGSIRKIAKPILPYSLHAGSDSEELRELQALLKEDLTLVEKMHVRKSIEQHKLGRNRTVFKEIRVVGATCAACPFQCMNNLSFPLVLLDECSQITEPVSLLPIARFGCEKLILVGDPKQLPPTIQGSESADGAGLEQTLFDRMCLMGYNPIMLRTQYRCHPTISAITNELFYNGNLRDGLSTSNLKPLLDWLPTLCFYNVKGRDQLDMDGSCHNVEEATFTVKLIQSLIASGIKGSMIGLITLYKSQMHRLHGLLNHPAQCDPAEIKAVQVSTVDAFQGAEKEIIILSCVRTRQLGFIDSEKRMNVALTRGKRHLLIVGNLTCLRNNRLWKRVIHHCEVRENGVQHAYQCEPQLEKIMKCYSDQMLAEKGQTQRKNPKSRNKSIPLEEDNKAVDTTEEVEGNKTPEAQDYTNYPE